MVMAPAENGRIEGDRTQAGARFMRISPRAAPADEVRQPSRREAAKILWISPRRGARGAARRLKLRALESGWGFSHDQRRPKHPDAHQVAGRLPPRVAKPRPQPIEHRNRGASSTSGGRRPRFASSRSSGLRGKPTRNSGSRQRAAGTAILKPCPTRASGEADRPRPTRRPRWFSLTRAPRRGKGLGRSAPAPSACSNCWTGQSGERRSCKNWGFLARECDNSSTVSTRWGASRSPTRIIRPG